MNNGMTPALAWKTISKLNSMLVYIKAGDNILFECGSVFFGGIIIPANISGTKGNPVVFGSYGSGPKPVICGSIPVSGWSQSSVNIWKASVDADSITQLFEGNNRLIHARFPNSGYYRVDNTNGKSNLTDANLSRPTNYWKNATLIFRLNEWLMEKVNIDSSNDAGLLTFSIGSDTSFNAIYPGAGYFIQNKYELLDTANEWFFDAKTKTLYIYTLTDPSSENVRASVYANGIQTGWPWVSRYISIQDIEFREHAFDEIQLYGSDGFTIKNCDIYNAGEYGIRLNSNYTNFIRYSEISNNNVENSSVTGIFTWNVAQSLFKGNKISKCGIYPAYGGILSFGGIGMNLFQGDSLTIIYNTIDSCGGTGLSMESNYSLVEKNIISHSMLLYSDGGAIYNGNGNYNIYRNNILQFTLGNMEAGYPGAARYTKELYLDAGIHSYNIIENNTFYSGNKNAGIGLTPNTFNMIIKNNVVYKCYRSLEIFNYFPIDKPVKNLDIRNNTFFANFEKAHPYCVNAWNGLTGMFQICDSNYLFNPFSDQIVEFQNASITSFLNFEQWKSQSLADSHSKTCFVNWVYPNDSSFILINETDTTKKYQFAEPIRDLDNHLISSTILLPFTSKVFIGSSTLVDTSIISNIVSVKKNYNMSVFPDPASDILNVEIEQPVTLDGILEIFCISGQLIYHQKIQSNYFTINLDEFADGMYIIKSGATFNKFIVRH